MNGLWKENVSGWDRKGTHRKKTTRNHTIKDKALVIIRNFSETEDSNVGRKYDTSILGNSVVTEHTYTGNKWGYTAVKYPDVVKTFKVRVHYKTFMSDVENTITFDAYFNDNKWYTTEKEYIFHKVGAMCKDFFVEKVRMTGELYLDWTKEKIRNEKVTVSLFPEGTTYFYGKPLPNWKKWTLYNDGKRRKIAQKHAHSMDRQNIRKWIHDEDWDAEVKTHALSKSIAWEIW